MSNTIDLQYKNQEEIILALMKGITGKRPHRIPIFMREFEALFGKQYESARKNLRPEELEAGAQKLIESLQDEQDDIKKDQIKKDFSLKDQEKIINTLIMEIKLSEDISAFEKEFKSLFPKNAQENAQASAKNVTEEAPKLMNRLQKHLDGIKNKERDVLDKITQSFYKTKNYVKENNLPEGFIKDIDLLRKERNSILSSGSITQKIGPFQKKAKGLDEQVKRYSTVRKELENLYREYEKAPSTEKKPYINQKFNELKQLTSKHSKDVWIENFDKKFIHPQDKTKEQLIQITALFKKIGLKLATLAPHPKKAHQERKQTQGATFGLSKKSRAPSPPVLEPERTSISLGR